MSTDPGPHRIFTQEDPIGLAGGLNLYGFAGGDPVNFGDPFGLCPACGTAVLGGTAGTAVMPGVGTVIGAVVGAVAGIAAGVGLGKLLGKLFSSSDEESQGANEQSPPEPTADEIISAEKKASIRRVFPSEMLGKTASEIEHIAKDKKHDDHLAAKRARKLLKDKRFNKDT